MSKQAETPQHSETKASPQERALPTLHERHVFNRNRQFYNAMQIWVKAQYKLIKETQDNESNVTPDNIDDESNVTLKTDKRSTLNKLTEDLNHALTQLNHLAIFLLIEYIGNSERTYCETAVSNLKTASRTIQTLQDQIAAYFKVTQEDNNKAHNDKALKIKIAENDLRSTLKTTEKIPELGAALLAYDRSRLAQRLYSAPESLIINTVSGVEQLRLALSSLDATCASSDAFTNIEAFSNATHTGSLIMTIVGISLMFFDALVQMCLAFKKRDYESKKEYHQRIKQNWIPLLKAKLFERGRWVAFVFSVLVATLLVITKVVFSGSNFATYAVFMVSKLVFASIACGLIGSKYNRLKKEIALLEKIKAAMKDPDNTEKLKRLKKIQVDEYISPEELERMKGILEITKEKPLVANKKSEVALKTKPGKINLFFIIPTFWIPLAVCWIVRTASKGKLCQFLVTKEKPKQEAHQAPQPLSVIQNLEKQTQKLAASFRQKVLCLGIKLTLLTAMVSTLCGVPPTIIGAIFIAYGAFHAAYKLTRFIMKKAKRKQVSKEIKALPGAIGKKCKQLKEARQLKEEQQEAQRQQKETIADGKIPEFSKPFLIFAAVDHRNIETDPALPAAAATVA